MNTEITHVYCMPGMSANPKIFEHITLDEHLYKIHYLSWDLPNKGDSLKEYAIKMCERVLHPNPILLGVSFGGILVQEMAKIIAVKKIVIISSVKRSSELPKKMLFAKYTKLHKLIPTQLVTNLELVAKFTFGDFMHKRLHLYEKYLSVRDSYYISWSINCIVGWEQENPLPNTIHIHGTSDAVFPTLHIKDFIPVEGGTHSMIIYKYKWFSENLSDILNT